MAKTAYIATIQVIIVGVDSQAEACDFISETLRPMENVLDWQYLPVGGHYLAPAEKIIPDNYEEGDGF
jgi:hypothetical protein